MVASLDFVLSVLKPVVDEFTRALRAVAESGFGAVTLHFRAGQVCRISYQTSITTDFGKELDIYQERQDNQGIDRLTG